ncbi:hypothetical protein KDD30_03180 [Photobacterium sp. GJ3]|uniref:hypothetical protein n=1 Tax=Photobacterium sp. GJ3 TaxID=2829502 RepID=UPI001B8B7C6D|nr:hypothetical protein [Photobacterium sp. GJ3]QUJ68166.1 hypothetical protein KDD30_03180 [Photobacterium sp. GJ3]
MKLRPVFVLFFSFLSWAAAAQIYPSTGAAWIDPGQWEEPMATTRFDSADAVQRWESRHADLSLGGWGTPELNSNSKVLLPLRPQHLSCQPDEQQAWLVQQAVRAGLDPETLYLHYAEDTRLSLSADNLALNQRIEARPKLFLQAQNGTLSPAVLPVSIPADQRLVVLTDHPFTRFELAAEVLPSEVSWHDETQESQPLEVIWQPDRPTSVSGSFAFPTGWQARVWPGLRESQWALILQWPQAVSVAALHPQPWLIRGSETLTIPGWDPRNDRDNNGMLSDEEFELRANAAASARFPYQARVIVVDESASAECTYQTNLTDPAIRNLIQGWYRYHWQREAAAGGDLSHVRPVQQRVLSGGKLLELPLIAGTAEAEQAYFDGVMDMLTQMKRQLSPPLLGADVSGLSLWQAGSPGARLREVVDVWIRPRYLSPAMGLARLQRSWRHFALSAQGRQSVLMVAMEDGHSRLHPGDAGAWYRDAETGLALYYLFNLPQQTYYHNWGRSRRYDSANTTMRDWYRPGLPKNWVYQPTGMLKVDLGQPVAAPKGYKAVWWQGENVSSKSGQGTFGNEPVLPAHWFWLYRSGWFGKMPAEGVIARRYEHGLVVYRAVQQAGESRFLEAKPIRISLPGRFERIFYDGSVSEPLNYLELGGYEGAVLHDVRE